MAVAVQLLKFLKADKVSEELREIAFMEYARELLGAGLNKAAKHFVQYAGPRGNNLLKEIEILNSDNWLSKIPNSR